MKKYLLLLLISCLICVTPAYATTKWVSGILKVIDGTVTEIKGMWSTNSAGQLETTKTIKAGGMILNPVTNIPTDLTTPGIFARTDGLLYGISSNAVFPIGITPFDISSSLVSSLSFSPYSPITSIGGYDLNYALIASHPLKTDTAYTDVWNVTRMDSLGVAHQGRALMLGSSVLSTISWDDASSYLLNASTTHDFSESLTGTAVKTQLDSGGYIEQLQTRGAANNVSSLTATLPKIGSNTYYNFFDIIVLFKIIGTADGQNAVPEAATAEGSIAISLYSNRNSSSNRAIRFYAESQDATTSNIRLGTYSPTEGFWMWTSGADVTLNGHNTLRACRITIPSTGIWTANYLNAGVPTTLAHPNLTPIDSDMTVRPVDALNTWSTDAVFGFSSIILSTAQEGETKGIQVYGLYIYWE